MALFPIKNPLLTKLKRTQAEADPFGTTVPRADVPTPVVQPAEAGRVTITPAQSRDEAFLQDLLDRRPEAEVTVAAEPRPGTIGGALGAAAVLTLEPIVSVADTLLSPLQPSVPGVTPSGVSSVQSEQSALDVAVIAPLDFLAESALSLAKLEKPKGYTEALANFRGRSVIVQVALGMAFDPAIIFGILGVSARTSRVAVRAAVSRQLERELPRATKAVLDSAVDVTTDRVVRALGNERGGILRSDDVPRIPTEDAAELVSKQAEGLRDSLPKVNEALTKAEEFRKVDAPGFVGQSLDRVPGVKQVIDFFRPANKRSPEVQLAWNAEGSEAARLSTEMTSERLGIFTKLKDQFHPNSLRGQSDTPVNFTGTETERAVNKSGDITGSLLDIAQRPHLYDLTSEQKAVLGEWQAHQSKFMRQAIDEYGAPYTEFSVAPGSVFLSNVDVNTNLLDAFGITAEQAVARGRGSTRTFQTAAERMKALPDFVPNTDIIQLQTGMDAWKGQISALEVFKQGIGGKTLVELMDELHPNLVKAKAATTRQITNLRSRITTANRQADAVTRETRFTTTKIDQVEKRAGPLLERLDELGEEWGPELSTLSGQVRELHLQARQLERKGISLTDKSLEVSGRRETLLTELSRLAPELESLRRRYAAANLGQNKLVRESGIFRYFEPEVAEDITSLRKSADNKWFGLLDEIRATAFSADLSPIIGVQGALITLANPVMMTRRMVGAGKASIEARDFLHVFRQDTMTKAVAENPQEFADFSFWTQISIGSGTPKEFSAGLIGKTKLFGIGEKFRRINESMFTLIHRQSVAAWGKNRDVLLKGGISIDEAQMVAADLQHKIVPIWSPIRLGLTPGRAQAFRALATSVSFITKPAEMMATAANGFAKMATKQTLSAQEILAVRVALSMNASLLTLSISSTVASALERGRDPWQAVQEVVNPTSGKFLCLTIGTRCIPLGGPYRAIFKAITPRPIDEGGVPIPFAGVPKFFTNRANPFLQGQRRLIQNRDFQGGRIIPDDAGAIEKIIRVLLYEFESMAPLVLGTAVEGVRQGQPGGDIAEELVAQAAGTNIQQETEFQFRDLEVRKFAKAQGIPDVSNYFDLEPRHRDIFERANPEIFDDISREIQRRADQGIESFVRRQRAIDIRETSKSQQLADDELLQLTFAKQPGGMGAKAWRENRRERAEALSSQREELFHDLDIRDPKTPLDFYYQKLDAVQTEHNGIMNEDAWEEMERWQAEQSDADQRYVDENTGLNSITPLVQEWRDDLEVMKPYFEIYENRVKPAIPESVAEVYERWLKGGPTVRSDISLTPEGALVNGVQAFIEGRQLEMIVNVGAINDRLVKWEYSVELIKRILAGTVR